VVTRATRPPCGGSQATSRARAPANGCRERGPADIEPRSLADWLGSPRLAHRTAHLRVARRPLEGRMPPRRSGAPGGAPHGATTLDLRSRADPRRSVRSHGDRGAFHRRARRLTRRSLSTLAREGLRPRGPTPLGWSGDEPLRPGAPAPLVPLQVPSVTRQAPGDGSTERRGTNGLALATPSTPRRSTAAPATASLTDEPRGLDVPRRRVRSKAASRARNPTH